MFLSFDLTQSTPGESLAGSLASSFLTVNEKKQQTDAAYQSTQISILRVENTIFSNFESKKKFHFVVLYSKISPGWQER